jgi:hypothetical protein
MYVCAYSMQDLKSELGRGRKRGPKSSGNENIEEILTLCPSPLVLRWNHGLVFPNASHSYRS